MRTYKYIFCFLFIPLFSPDIDACTVWIEPDKYVNIISMHGPQIKGLRWDGSINVLFYDGDEKISVSGIKGGRVFKIVKWDKGVICFYDRDGIEECPGADGVDLASSFGWTEQSNSKKDFKAIKDKIKVRIADSDEIEYTFENRRVRNTKERFQELYAKWATAICEGYE